MRSKREARIESIAEIGGQRTLVSASRYIGQLWESFAWIIRRGKKTNPVNVTELSSLLLNSTNALELRADSNQEKSSLAFSHDDIQLQFVIK